MPRRRGFVGVVTAIAREAARQQRLAETARRRQQREADMAQRRAIREAAQLKREMEAAQKQAMREEANLKRDRQKKQSQADKEARQRYLEDRIAEIESLNSDIQEQISELSRILEHTLDIDDTISFDTLKINDHFPDFYPPNEFQMSRQKPERQTFLSKVVRPSGIKSLIPGAKSKYERERKQAEEEFRLARERWKTDEQNRLEKLEAARRDHEENKIAFERKKEQRNAEVEEFEQAYRSADSEAVVAYNNMVLDNTLAN